MERKTVMTANVNLHNLSREFDPDRVNADRDYLGAYIMHHDAMDEAVKPLSREDLERLAIGVADEFYAFKMTVAIFLTQRGFADACRLRPFLYMAQSLHNAWKTSTTMDIDNIDISMDSDSSE